MADQSPQPEVARLKAIAVDLHWMARRYADGRQSYATSLHNDNTRALLAMGVPLNATGDGTLWARDSGGRAYDGLTDEEAAQGRNPDWKHDNKERQIEQQDALLRQMADALRNLLSDSLALGEALLPDTPEDERITDREVEAQQAIAAYKRMVVAAANAS